MPERLFTLQGSGSNQAKIYLDYPNKRLKVTASQGDEPYLLDAEIKNLARREGLTKILWLLRPEEAPPLLAAGYIIEGRFASYLRGRPAVWLSYFMTPERRRPLRLAEEELILWRTEKKRLQQEVPELPPPFYLKKVLPEEAPQLARLYGATFVSYPTPVTEVDYLYQSMAADTVYMAVFNGDGLVSAASGVMDKDNLAAEISDCATRPEYRGQGLMRILIKALETELRAKGIITLFSLARALSLGMNSALYQSGYTFRGRFINNCHICGQFEDMNLWTREEFTEGL
ncbi:MAG: beta-lysine N6-acetyltransferase [Moorella sp. (in: firmicutes)]|nr:beta-lysine N6-acetyltransferase [Moorella sp. (in: firmicutes)]